MLSPAKQLYRWLALLVQRQFLIEQGVNPGLVNSNEAGEMLREAQHDSSILK